MNGLFLDTNKHNDMVTYTKLMHKLSKRGRKQSNGVNRRTLRLCDDHWNNDNIVDRFLYK